MNALRRQIQSMLDVHPREGGFSAIFKVDPGLSIFPDHFRDSPILPGVCMIQAVLLASAQTCNLPDLEMRLLKSAKMMRPVRPGDQVQIDATLSPAAEGNVAIKATFTTDTAQRCAEFSLIAAPPLPPGWGEGELRTPPPVTRASGPCQAPLSNNPPESGAP